MNTQHITLSAFDYTQAAPCSIYETDRWAVVYKPPHIPTAPLRADEDGTLVQWFLSVQPEPVSCICGKKAIEAGLVHRLDTDTRGLVLFAKDQQSYDFFQAAQTGDAITKTYYAFVKPLSEQAHYRTELTVPKVITSQYRNYGPKAQKTAPVFPGSRHYTKDGRLYTTVIEEYRPAASAIRCRLTRGYRHQVRTHLAAIGLPIAGDPLYGIDDGSCIPLQLYATALTFPLPENRFAYISVALPPPKNLSFLEVPSTYSSMRNNSNCSFWRKK